jgi:hypothetical protein
MDRKERMCSGAWSTLVDCDQVHSDQKLRTSVPEKGKIFGFALAGVSSNRQSSRCARRGQTVVRRCSHTTGIIISPDILFKFDDVLPLEDQARSQAPAA